MIPKNEWPLLTFLAWTCSVVGRDGFLSRRYAKYSGSKKATWQKVVDLLTPMAEGVRYKELSGSNWQERELYRPCSVNDKEAREVYQWALNLTDEEMDKESYLHNLNVIAKLGVVQRRVAGLAASMVSEYHKRMKKGTNR